MKMLRKAVLGAALGASALGLSAPASAEHYGYGWRHHDGGDDAGIAIGAGVIGLALGAAIASNNNDRYRDRGYYYDRDRYDDGHYYYRPPVRYYYRPYDRGYSYRHCWTERVWDDYRRGWARVEQCR